MGLKLFDSELAVCLCLTGVFVLSQKYGERLPDPAQMEAAAVLVIFGLKDGGRELRRFQIEDREKLLNFQEIYGTEEYKRSIFPILKEENVKDKLFTWQNGMETRILDLTEKEKLEFIYLTNDMD